MHQLTVHIVHRETGAALAPVVREDHNPQRLARFGRLFRHWTAHTSQRVTRVSLHELPEAHHDAP